MTVTTTQTSPSHSNLTGSVHQHQPSVASLVRSTAVSAAVAAVLAVTCVLPAEYAIDPTGAGHVLGLTQMGQIKRDAEIKLANGKKALLQSPSSIHFASGSHIISDAMPIGEAWARLAQAAPAAAAKVPAAKTDTLEIVLEPNAKMELKAWMKKGESYSFTWSASSAINFNFHGEKHNAPASEYTEYKKGVATTDKGEFTAGYDGTHGWSWRNRTKQPITVKATIIGSYEKFAEKKG